MKSIQNVNINISKDHEERWKLRCEFFQQYHKQNKFHVDPEIIGKREEYLSECFDILLQIWMKEQGAMQGLNSEMKKWMVILRKIDSLFYGKYIAMNILTGQNNQNFTNYWQTFIFYLWSQLGNPSNTISQIFFTGNQLDLFQIINKIFQDVQISHRRQAQSPVFSEDSFDPLLYESKKNQQKYQKQKLTFYLSEAYIDTIKDRVREINDKEICGQLLSNIEKVLGNKQQ